MANDKSLAALEARLEHIESALLSRVPQVFDPAPDESNTTGKAGGLTC